MNLNKVGQTNRLTVPGNQSEQDHFQHEFIIAFVIIFISTVILILVNIAISYFIKNQLDPNIVVQITPPFVPHFAPEQVERTQYLVFLIGFPVLSFSGWLIASKLGGGNDYLRPILFSVIASFVTAGFGLWLFFLEITGIYYIKGFTFLSIIFYLFILLIIYIQRKYSPTWLEVLLKICTIGIGLFLSFVIVFLCIKTENDITAYTYHLNAYLYSVVQVFEEKTLLIDLTNQYGFYPYFLQPIFKIIGLDVIQFSAVMGLLLAGSFLILFFLINRLVKNRAISICAFLAIPGVYMWFNIVMIGNEIVYQYTPHRLVFPALLLLLVWFYQKTNGKFKISLYYLTFILCGMSLIWNIDSGVFVFGSWILFLYWETLGQCKSLHFKQISSAIMKHTLLSLTVLILSIGSVYIYTFLRSGIFPDIGNILTYQSVWYGSGLTMLPMPLLHPWNLVALTYIFGIYVSFSGLVKKMVGASPAGDQIQTSRDNMIFIVSILGAGLFSYYQGRSADPNLVNNFWSVFFLIALYADSLLGRFDINFYKSPLIRYRVANIATGMLFMLLSFALIFYAGGVVQLFPQFTDRIQTQIRTIDQLNKGVAGEHTQEINFIRKYFSPGDQVLILSSNHQATYYMKSRTTNPLDIPSIIEIVYKTDYEKLRDYLINGILVNKNGRRASVKVLMSDDFKEWYPDLFQLVNENYSLIDRINDLSLLEKK